MADPITNAKLEQKRIEAEIEALRGKLNKVASFIEMYEEFAGRPDVTAAAISPPPFPHPGGTRPAAHDS